MWKQSSQINGESIYQSSDKRYQIGGSIERKSDVIEIEENRNEESELNTDKYNKFTSEEENWE